MMGYRQAFKRLGDDLSTEGKLKSSAKLPVERKLLVFLLSITGATDAKKITRAQWDNFFSRATTVAGPADARVPEGLIGLAKLVNKANGIEEKKERTTREGKVKREVIYGFIVEQSAVDWSARARPRNSIYFRRSGCGEFHNRDRRVVQESRGGEAEKDRMAQRRCVGKGC